MGKSVIWVTGLLTMALLFQTGCSGGPEKSETGRFLDVRAMHNSAENRHLFELGSHTIPAGWTTIQFTNSTPYDHFFVMYKVPDEALASAENAGEPILDHWFRGVTEPFQLEYNAYLNGNIDYGTFVNNLVGTISDRGPWFLDPGAPPMGGPGFTAAGRISETSVFLEPGEYVVECYVKNDDEQFHSYLGMLEHFTVTTTENGAEEPVPTGNLAISSENGIVVDGEFKPGRQIIEIRFEDQATYDHLLGHNVQLVKLQDKNDREVLDDLATWMNWSIPGSLVNRAPGNALFMGGSMQMTEGSKTFFHVELEPGDYTWIAEVPDPAGHDMLRPFTVSE
jgi:hypothetical protein